MSMAPANFGIALENALSAARSIVERCPFCNGETSDTEDCVIIERRSTGMAYHAHKECRAKRQAEDEQLRQGLQERRREEGLRLIAVSWQASAQHDLASFPRWDFARFENDEFMKRASRAVVAGVSAWPGDRPLFVSGKTGSGKTASMVAWMHQRRAQFEAEPEAIRRGSLGFFFTSGPSLAGCRRRGKIGEEAKLVELAIETPLLVLDELGYEPLSEELLTVVDERHKRGAVTATTTGRTLESFAERYGGSIFRKLTEGGTVVEGWK
jgi:DNA replication protein DnaC